MKYEYISFSELVDAYIDCLKHKSNKVSALEFRFRENENLLTLYEELNNRTYKISESIAFCVTRPKLREIFAANFRDRIVHHVLINRYGNMIDESFIDDSYNCRKGKGTQYAVSRLQKMLIRSDKDDYIMKCDLKGFFMSISKEILWRKIESFLTKGYIKRCEYEGIQQCNEDLDWVLWLTKMVIFHRPETCCKRQGDLSLWDRLESDKSLFSGDGTKGLAIGNLTSQIYANFYMNDFDYEMKNRFGEQYGRYVDDFVCVGRKKKLIKTIKWARKYLKEELDLNLHPNKFYMQPVKNGTLFVGSIVQKGRVLCGGRTISNLFDAIERFNKNVSKAPVLYNKFHKVLCSYFGFLVHNKTYRVREKMWRLVNDKWRKYLYIDLSHTKIRIRQNYKQL